MVKAINYILVNDAAVGSLVGTSSTNTKKIYPVIATQKESFPFVTVWETARIPEYCRGQRPTTFNYSYEVHVYAPDYDEANAICNAICNALEDTNVSSPVNGVKFTDRIRNTNRRDQGWIEEYKVYNKILSFEAPVNEDQAT